MLPPNPAEGKQSAEYKPHTRTTASGKRVRVRGHTRSVKGRRMLAASASAGTAGVVTFFTLFEAAFTIGTAIGVLLIGAFTWLAVIIGGWAEENRKTLNAQQKRRSSARSRTSARTTRTRRTTGRR